MYGNTNNNQFAECHRQLPPPSIELSSWLIRVLAEDGKRMFSHMTIRAINFALYGRDGKTKMSLLHTTTEMLTKITASHIASTSVIHLEKMQAILEYFVQQYTEGSEGSEGSEGRSKDKQHVILLQATTACLAVLIPLLQVCKTPKVKKSLKSFTNIQPIEPTSTVLSLDVEELVLDSKSPKLLSALINLRSFVTNKDDRGLRNIYKQETKCRKDVIIVGGNFKSESFERDMIAKVEAAGNKITKNYEGAGVYIGQMEGGKRHGYGTWTHPNGFKYVGEWKNGKIKGYSAEYVNCNYGWIFLRI